jgi:choline dehydrogenase-like flavoprotein
MAARAPGDVAPSSPPTRRRAARSDGARDSVADPDGQVWGVDGLYVTDASDMPTASGVNPMLSILALARCTAQRMVAR